jgi:hypothetical protein
LNLTFSKYPAKSSRAEVISWKEQVQNMSEEEFGVFLRKKTEEILNRAADGVFDEIVDKVMEGEEEEQGAQVGEVLSKKSGDVGVEDKWKEATTIQDASKLQVQSSPRL